jgi:GNAT superfamily N-acetyltransferase
MNIPPSADARARDRDAVARVRPVFAAELEELAPTLARLLVRTVNAGSGLGFVPPVPAERVRDYWISLLPELRGGSRVLLVAEVDGCIVGSGQFWMPRFPAALHRAEIQKLFVDLEARGQRIGELLMAALHDAARVRGRSLLVLNTRRGAPPERFYRRLGYLDLGVLPGGIRGAAGERYDLLTMFRDLAQDPPGPPATIIPEALRRIRPSPSADPSSSAGHP